MRLLDNIGVSVLGTGTSAGTSTITTSTIDLAGCEGCLIIGSVGTPDATNTVGLTDSADDSSYAAVTGSTLATGTAAAFAVELYKPTKRYARVVVTRAVSTTITPIYVIKFGKKLKPLVSALANVLGLLQLVSP